MKNNEHRFYSLDWNEIVHHIQNFSTSGTAKMALQNLAPLESKEAALQKAQDIFDATQILTSGTRPFMESLDLFEPWYSRLKKKAVLKTIEMKDVRTFCLETIALTEALKICANNWSQNVLQNLMDATEPLSAIDQILTPNGEIRSDASETLYRLFREKENLAKQIQTTLDRLVHDHDMQTSLQDRYVTTREGRWVLPIRSGQQHSVGGVIHGSSQTKQTVFMEPEVVIPINNRLRQCEVEIEAEIERLLIELSNYLSTQTINFEETKNRLEEADQLFALGQWTIQTEGKPFSFSENEIFLVDVRHPLMQISAKKPVANTVQMNAQKNILLLSGPNAGGKTVLLKSIGLAAHMARCGIPLCASEQSQVPFFEKILIGIGDSQSVDEQLSTFAAHLQILQNASNLKGPNNLILIDEICGSTDPEEGSSLARSFIEEFARNSVFAVITSHLGPLKSGWKETPQVMSGSLEYDAQTGRPTYQYLPGVPGDSLAIQTAKRVGVAKKILDRAIELLSPTTRTRLAGMEEIENLKSDIHTLREHLKKETALAQHEKEKYTKLLTQLEKEKENLVYKAVRDAEKKIEEMIALTKTEVAFKKHASLTEIKNTLPEIIKSKPSTQQNQSAVTTADEFLKRYPPGSKVFVPSLNQDGIVQSNPNNKGEVFVLSNSIRLSLPWHELKPAASAQNPTAQLVRKVSRATVSLSDLEKTIDLRGLITEEAISHLETELDQASARKEDRIKIIHGHGTEALKKAVRTYLSRSVYVKKWKAGSPEQGGDGVTWAELGDE